MIDSILLFFAENYIFVAIINIFSLASFIIGIVVWHGVRNIKNSYLFKARVPEHLEKLKEYSTKLLDIFKEYSPVDNNGDLYLEYIKNEFNTIEKKIGKNFDIRSITKIVKDINQYRSTRNKSREEFWKIYVNIKGAIQLIDNYKKDTEWEK